MHLVESSRGSQLVSPYPSLVSPSMAKECKKKLVTLSIMYAYVCARYFFEIDTLKQHIFSLGIPPVERVAAMTIADPRSHDHVR